MDSLKNHLFLFFIVGISLGCQSDDADVSNPDVELFEQQQETIEQYLTERNITTQQNDEGIHYQILTESDSSISPEPGQVVHIYYRIEQLEGGLVDAREESAGQDPVTYTFGVSGPSSNVRHLLVPVGLDAMVNAMREGEEYEFYLPSAYAYLDYSISNRIPANAIIRAQIQLARVLTPAEQRLVEDGQIKKYLVDQQLSNADSLSSGVYYLPAEAGDGTTISDGSTVKVRYTGQLLDGTMFDTNVGNNRPLFELTVAPNQVIDGFLLAVQHMSLGEKGTVVIPSHAAYGQGLIAIPYAAINDFTNQNAVERKIPPYSPLRFDIEIVEVN